MQGVRIWHNGIELLPETTVKSVITGMDTLEFEIENNTPADMMDIGFEAEYPVESVTAPEIIQSGKRGSLIVHVDASALIWLPDSGPIHNSIKYRLRRELGVAPA